MQQRHTTLIAGTTTALLTLILLAIVQYNWNVSALLRIDREFGEHFRVPHGTVLFEDGGYDGMLYYQIARDLPQLFSGKESMERYENAYRMQRIFLPFLAFILSHGNADVLPFTILLINLSAVIGAFALLLFYTLKCEALGAEGGPQRWSTTLRGRVGSWEGNQGFPFHALTLVFNPAALVGILFSLTEPLALFLTTAFLLLFLQHEQRLNVLQLILLALAMFARETTIMLIALLFLFFLLKREGRQALMLLTSLLPFAIFQFFLTVKLGALPLAAGAGMMNMPLSGPWHLVMRSIIAPNMYVLSSLSFLLLFALPLLCYLLQQWWQKRSAGVGLAPHRGEASGAGFLLTGLTAMLFLLDAHIWGAITSVGRVLPALYPVYALWASEQDTPFTRSLSAALMTISVVAALGIALTSHPFTIA